MGHSLISGPRRSTRSIGNAKGAGEGVTTTTDPSYDQKSETRRVAVSLVCGRATAADSRMAAVNPTDDDRKLETAVIVC